MKCGIYSEFHETQKCLAKYKAKQDIVHCYPNWNQAHHAWNKSCPARLRLVEWGREWQPAWISSQQKTATISAPPGTFVWGQQLPTALPPARAQHPPISHLSPTATDPRQPPTTSLTVWQPSRATRTIVPLCTTPSSLLTTHYLFTSTSLLHFLHPDTRHASADFSFSIQWRDTLLPAASNVLPRHWKRAGKRSLLDTRRCFWLSRLPCHL